MGIGEKEGDLPVFVTDILNVYFLLAVEITAWLQVKSAHININPLFRA